MKYGIFIIFYYLFLTIQTREYVILQQQVNLSSSTSIPITVNQDHGRYVKIKATILHQPDLVDHKPVLICNQSDYNGNNVIDDLSNRDILDLLNKGLNSFYIDEESYASRSSYHFIQFESRYQSYKLQFRDLLTDQTLKIDLSVIVTDQKSCYKECQTCNPNTFVCECQYKAGLACEHEYEMTEPNYKYSFYKIPSDWISFGFKVKKDHQYDIVFQSISKGSYFQYVKLNSQDIQVPNFIEHLFKINNNSYKYTFSSDRVNSYVDFCNSLDSCNSSILIISLYSPYNSNPNDQSLLELRETAIEESQGIYFLLLLTIGIILTIASIVSCIYVCYKEKKHQQEQQQQAQQNEQQQQNQQPQQNGPRIIIQKVAITQQSIEKYMPIIKYQEAIKDIEDLQDQKECIVCLCEFEPDDDVRISVCFHIFHKGCIDNWIKKHGTCPFCRHKLTKKIFEDHTTLKTEVMSNPYMKKVIEAAKSDAQSPLTTTLSKMKEFDFIFSEEKSENKNSEIRKEELSIAPSVPPGSQENPLVMQNQISAITNENVADSPLQMGQSGNRFLHSSQSSGGGINANNSNNNSTDSVNQNLIENTEGPSNSPPQRSRFATSQSQDENQQQPQQQQQIESQQESQQQQFTGESNRQIGSTRQQTIMNNSEGGRSQRQQDQSSVRQQQQQQSNAPGAQRSQFQNLHIDINFGNSSVQQINNDQAEINNNNNSENQNQSQQEQQQESNKQEQQQQQSNRNNNDDQLQVVQQID